jgi:hypothetical protein
MYFLRVFHGEVRRFSGFRVPHDLFPNLDKGESVILLVGEASYYYKEIIKSPMSFVLSTWR